MSDFITQMKTMDLNIFDKMFLIGFTFLVFWLLYNGLSILTFGGIVLIYGAFLTYKGQIFFATASYLLADVCWITNAWKFNDFQGVLFISIGITFGVIATLKMKNGNMKKDLLHKPVNQ